ncbi:hypothetical protein TYRP_001130 [Tyrophagus putrescentiae]|nr:hypothetical protein TYRP_001130 [Tyrophagus putrescentiae]
MSAMIPYIDDDGDEVNLSLKPDQSNLTVLFFCLFNRCLSVVDRLTEKQDRLRRSSPITSKNR